MANIKISQLPLSGTPISASLLEVASFDGVSTYSSVKVPLANIATGTSSYSITCSFAKTVIGSQVQGLVGGSITAQDADFATNAFFAVSSSLSLTSSYISTFTSSVAPNDTGAAKQWITTDINGVSYKIPLYL